MIIPRRCEVIRNDVWTECHMKDIKKGDMFRLFEPDGTQVEGPTQENCWVAASDATPVDPPGNYSVITERG